MSSISENLRSNDESQQLMAALELSETLLMSQEDVMYSLPLMNIITALIEILNKDHNPELMMAAARCFAGILEVSPQMAVRMTAAVPVFVSKLSQLEYIDLVEVCLTVLDRLSRAHGHQIITSGCFSKLQVYFDFFSSETQTAIFRTMANCAHFIRAEQLKQHISNEMIGAFGQRMCLVKNKTSLETLCTFFTRVVENCAFDVGVLRTHFGVQNDFLHCILSTLHHRAVEVGGGATLLRLMEIISYRCRDLAVELIKLDVAETLHLLLCGAEMNAMETSTQKKADLTTQRPSNQICQILRLYCDLLPKLPKTGVFSINDVLLKYPIAVSSSSHSLQPVVNHTSAVTARIETDGVTGGSTSKYHWYMKRDPEYNVYSGNEDDDDNEDDEDSHNEGEEDVPGPSSGTVDDNLNNEETNNKEVDKSESSGGDKPESSVDESKPNDEPTGNSDSNDAGCSTDTMPSSAAAGNAPKPPVTNTADRSPAGFEDWCALSTQDSVMLELSYTEFGNHDDEEEMTVHMLTGDEFDLDLNEMACYHYRSNVRFLLERRLCKEDGKDGTGASKAKEEEFVDEREVFRTSGENAYTKLLSLFPLLVDIGNASTCANVRFGVLSALNRSLYSCSDSKDILTDLVKDVPLSSFISGTLNSHGKHLGMVVACVQLVRQVLDNLSEVYVPLFESEGVLHEIRKHLKLHAPKSKADKPGTSKADSALSDGAVEKNKESKSKRKKNKRKMKKATQAAQSSSNETITSTASDSATSNVPPSAADSQQQSSSAASHENPETSANKTEKNKVTVQSSYDKQRELKMLKDQSLSAFIGLQCAEIIAIVDELQKKETEKADQCSYSPNTSLRLLASIAKRLTNGEDVGVEPLVELRELLTNANVGSVTGFQFNQSGIFDALNRYLTETSDVAKDSNRKALFPDRSERLRRFVSVFTGDFFKVEKSDRDESVESFKNLINRIVTTLGQFERFPIRVTTTAFMEEDNTMSPSFNIAEQTLRVIQRKQLFCSLKRHESCRSPSSTLHDRISVRPLAPISTLENFVLENVNAPSLVNTTSSQSLSSTQASVSTAVSGDLEYSDDDDATGVPPNGEPSVANVAIGGFPDSSSASDNYVPGSFGASTSAFAASGNSAASGSAATNPPDNAPSGSSAVESRKSSTTSYASTAEGDEWRVNRSRSSSRPGRVELYFGPHKIPTGISILQAIVQYATDLEDGGTDVIPESIWNRNHVFHYRVVLEENQPIAPMPSTSSAAEGSRKSTSGESTARSKNAPSGDESRLSPPSRKMAKIDISRPMLSSSDMSMDVDAKEKSGTTIMLERYLDSAITEVASLKFSDDPAVDCLLVLLKSLHGMNTLAWSLQEDEALKFVNQSPILPMSAFFVNKLDSKVMRQLTDVLCVVLSRLPKWLKLLVTKMPFAFQFSTRLNFLHATVFGNARAMRHLLHENKVNRTRFSKSLLCKLVPEINQRKVTVKRCDLLKDAVKILDQSDRCGDLLDVQFEGEVGSGHGPTLEFYSSLSRELQRYSLKLWAGTSVAERIEERNNPDYKDYFTMAENGLYPRVWFPTTDKKEKEERKLQLKYFKFLGQLLAQALIDGRLLDIPFAPCLFKWLLKEEENLNFEDFACVEPTFYNSFFNLLNTTDEEFTKMEMDFTYPGTDFELLENGANTAVTKENLPQFIKLVTVWRLHDGVRSQMLALRNGFYTIIKIDSQMPAIFDVKEIEQIFCGNADNDSGEAHAIWATDALWRNFRVDHGYFSDSPQVKWLAQMLNGFIKEQRRKFLQFVTGSPRLPIGGFAALSPPLTVVRKVVNDPFELPSAMTCFNYLKLPAYETYEQLVERFLVALEFTHSFHLS